MRRMTLLLVGLMIVAMAACGGDDAGDEATSDAASTDEVTGSVPPAAPGLEVPADYPLPIPDGGSLQRVLVDEANESTNIALAYPAGSFDSLVAEYDEFFATTSGTTDKAGPNDGLVSWQNEELGSSVVINDQGTSVSVVLQTGV